MTARPYRIPVLETAKVTSPTTDFDADSVFNETVEAISEIRSRMSALLAEGKVKTHSGCKHTDFRFIHQDPQDECQICQQFDMCTRKACLNCGSEF